MALYLGTSKSRITSDGALFNLHLYSSTIITNGDTLLSSEGYVLKDTNGLYLTTKEDEELWQQNTN